MIRAASVLVLVGLLSGCAGQSTYTLRPYADPATGQAICCEAIVKSSKDVDGVTVHATRAADGSLTLDFSETGASASKPIAAQSGAITSVSNAVSNTAAAVVKLSP